MPSHRTRTLIAAVFSVTLLAPLCGLADTAPLTVPQTAPEHHARAATYQQKAAAAREDAEAHRKMLAEYKKTAVAVPKGPENPWVAKMRQHCDDYIKADEALAQQADEMAKFHEMRAMELEGK